MKENGTGKALVYGSICSGIEAASVAWRGLGWKCAFVAEIEAFPCAVLKHHYPTVPNHGDMTKHLSWPKYAIDILVGGTPCQSFSVAGLRAGLADPRGNLTLTFLAVVAPLKAESGTNGKGDGAACIANGMSVRRLTPKECARLQGFPDDYLDINFRGKPAADGPKYRALGNSMAVPVMRWIGQRIGKVEGMR
jgi:site-specific DNA-cytosine methylase